MNFSTLKAGFRSISERIFRDVKEEWRAFVAVTAGVSLQALAVVLFVLPNRFPDLGVSGIAVLSNYVFGISPAWVILAANTLLMIWAWKELSPRFVLWTAWAVVLFSLLLKAFEFVPVPVIGDKFMAAMVSGVIREWSSGPPAAEAARPWMYGGVWPFSSLTRPSRMDDWSGATCRASGESICVRSLTIARVLTRWCLIRRSRPAH